MKRRTAENAIIKLLKRNKVRNNSWKRNLESLYKIGNIQERRIRERAMMNQIIRIRNMIFMFEMKELLYLIACTFSGTEFWMFVRSILKPLRYFQPRSGLRYRLTNLLSAKLKKASCKTPNSSKPTIFTLIMAKNIIIQLATPMKVPRRQKSCLIEHSS